MPITFVYRSPYQNLTGRYIKKFPHESLLEWFQEHWDRREPSDEPWLSEILLGQNVYGFGALFDAIEEHKIPVPKTNEELGAILKQHIYAEGGPASFSPRWLHVATDDDEWELRYNFLDDRYIEQKPEVFAFLTHEGSLPSDVAEVESEPCTYLFVHSPVASCDSQRWDRVIAKGARLDDVEAIIDAYAVDSPPREHPCWEADEVRELLIAKKADGLSWPQLLEEIAEIDYSYARKENRSQIECSEHICQLHHHAWDWAIGDRDPIPIYFQVVVFDDIWAASHPFMLESMQCYADDEV